MVRRTKVIAPDAKSAEKARLRGLLKEGALRYAERDRRLAEEWAALDKPLRREDPK